MCIRDRVVGIGAPAARDLDLHLVRGPAVPGHNVALRGVGGVEAGLGVAVDDGAGRGGGAHLGSGGRRGVRRQGAQGGQQEENRRQQREPQGAPPKPAKDRLHDGPPPFFPL